MWSTLASMSKSTNFDFGSDDPQQNLFDAGEASEVCASESLEKDSIRGEDGASPISPLQLQPKELRLEKIARATARNIWLTKHYLKRDFSNPSIELGVFDKSISELVGAIAFSARLGGSKQGGAPHIWEIRRMWLSDERCARNCESRVLSIACRIIVPSIAPHVRQIISYSDLKMMGHKGIIYKAAGFTYGGMTAVDEDGEGWGSHASHKVKDNWPKKRWILFLHPHEKTAKKEA
jgi:hypothetical protein